MQGWSKLGAYAWSNTSGFKTTTVFFSRKYGFNVLPLCLHSALYSCPCRTSRFLEAVATTWTTTTLAYNTTNHEISCDSARQVPCLMLWESTTSIYLAIYSCCSQQFLCHRSYACTCLDHELELCGRDSVHAHVQSSRVYPWRHARDKMYQALPNLSRESLGMRLTFSTSFVCLQ